MVLEEPHSIANGDPEVILSFSFFIFSIFGDSLLLTLLFIFPEIIS